VDRSRAQRELGKKSRPRLGLEGNTSKHKRQALTPTSSSFALAFNTLTKKSLPASWYLSRISATESDFALELEAEVEEVVGKAAVVETGFELLELLVKG
jgi:hypothetical protein